MRTSSLTSKDGDSKHRQKNSIMTWVKSNDNTVRGEYWDIESGKTDTMDRSEFMRMISVGHSQDNGFACHPRGKCRRLNPVPGIC